MPFYDLTILDGFGFAGGINDSGEITGIISNPQDVPLTFYSSWWVPPSYNLLRGPQGAFSKVDNAGDAVGFGPAVFNINKNMVVANLPWNQEFSASDVNNVNQVLANLYANPTSNMTTIVSLYDWVSQAVTTLDPLPGQTTNVGGGMNDHGDVVGYSGNRGFLYSNGQMSDVGACYLLDINDMKLAVGSVLDATNRFNVPAYIDLSQTNAQVQKIPMPYEADQYVTGEGAASAVNNENIIVGHDIHGPYPDYVQISNGYPFVYQLGQSGPAQDLNDLIPPNSGWYLSDAQDINNVGQIVGTAWPFDGSQVGTMWSPYVVTPRVSIPHMPPGKRPIIAPLTLNSLIATIIFGIKEDGGGLQTPGGHVPPWGPEAWTALPLEQREALLSFAISNMAGLMNDHEARTQIQRFATEAASRALAHRKRLHQPALSPAQKEQLAKTRKRMLHNLFPK